MFKKLNGSLERHIVGPHEFPHEVSTYIYIYIYIDYFKLCRYQELCGLTD